MTADKSAEPFVNDKGNFTCSYFKYYNAPTGAKQNKSYSPLFRNLENNDAISYSLVKTSHPDIKVEIIISQNARIDDYKDAVMIMMAKNQTPAGTRNAEYSAMERIEIARFPLTAQGADDACDFVRQQAKLRGMVQDNGWSFKMGF